MFDEHTRSAEIANNTFDIWVDSQLEAEGLIDDYGNDDIDYSGHEAPEITYDNIRGE